MKYPRVKLKPTAKIIADCDKIFSKYIRAKEKYVCRFHLLCAEKKIPAPCRCEETMQLCHKISRAKKAIKFDERNVFCGCRSSNLWASWNKEEWHDLWKRLFPEDVEYLRLRKDMASHRKRADYQLMILDILDKLKRLENK